MIRKAHRTVRLTLPGLMLAALVGCQTAAGPGTQPPGTTPPSAGGPAAPADGADPAVVERQRTSARPAPPWMIGKYTGRHLTMPIQDITLEVDATGRLTGKVSGILATGQYIGNDRVLWSHGSEVMVQRQPDGFRLVQTRNPSNATEYTRLLP
ncbi:MAG TPA: hypothetical protein PKA20_09510 [Burkholderiaceae bacterium]|nr:hypothetical protein [Burkholderiaceae bacterium]